MQTKTRIRFGFRSWLAFSRFRFLFCRGVPSPPDLLAPCLHTVLVCVFLSSLGCAVQGSGFTCSLWRFVFSGVFPCSCAVCGARDPRSLRFRTAELWTPGMGKHHRCSACMWAALRLSRFVSLSAQPFASVCLFVCLSFSFSLCVRVSTHRYCGCSFVISLFFSHRRVLSCVSRMDELTRMMIVLGAPSDSNVTPQQQLSTTTTTTTTMMHSS